MASYIVGALVHFGSETDYLAGWLTATVRKLLDQKGFMH